MTWVTDLDAKDVLVVVKLLSSPARGFRSLAGQFLVFQLLVVAVVLIAVAAVSVAQSTREFREVRGARMIAVAENMASTPIVRDRYADPFASTDAGAGGRPRASHCRARDWPRFIDPGGTVRVSSDPSRVGQRVDLGPTRADEGRAWFGDADIDGVHSLVGAGADPGRQRRRGGGRVGQRAVSVGVGTDGCVRRAPAVLPRPRCGAGPAGVMAAVAADQAAHPRIGDRRDRRSCRSSRSVVAQHPRGRRRGEQRR